MTKVDYGLRWRIEATRELSQRLLFFLKLGPLLCIVVIEGCRAGKRRGLLETDPAGTVCEGVSCAV